MKAKVSSLNCKHEVITERILEFTAIPSQTLFDVSMPFYWPSEKDLVLSKWAFQMLNWLQSKGDKCHAFRIDRVNSK